MSGISTIFKRLRLILILLIAAGCVGGGVYLWMHFGDSSKQDDETGTYTVQREDMIISCTEPGDIKALNSQDIKSKVEGHTTIISLVDEGTYITAEDVNNGKILVELDSSDIKQKLSQQEITFLSIEASYAEAIESLDIQKKQNDSDIKGGEMKLRFALMDMKKYMGEALGEMLMDSDINPCDPNNGIGILVANENLEGEALQKLRELDGNIYVAEQELELAKSKYEWTEKLYEKKYVSLSDKEADRLDKERKEIKRLQTKTAKELFVKYEFPKEGEKLMGDH